MNLFLDRSVQVLIIGCCFIVNRSFAQCGGPSPNLGPDTSVCVGQSIVLNPGSFSSYLWNNNSTQPTRTVSQAGTYWVKVGTVSSNLIVNGDFEQGNTGFTTDYVVGTGGSWGPISSEGQYLITTSPNLAHSNFSSCADHTPNPGTQMMVVNGANSPNTNVWCQTVAVSPNTDYQFSTWASTALNGSATEVAQLQFSINSIQLGSQFSLLPTGCTWSPFFQTWNSGIQTSAQICIVNQNNIGNNDFILDDISFAPICYETDTIVVSSINPPVISASPNDSICAGEMSSIIASSTNTNLTYTWNPGGMSGATLNVSPATSTFYNVSATSPEGCVSNLISRLVYVSPAPTVSLQTTDTVCANNQISIVAIATGTGLTYNWTPNLTSTNILSDISVTTTNYSIIVENSVGCKAFDTVLVNVIPELEIQIVGDLELCEGEVSLLTATGNDPNMALSWSTGATFQQISVNPLVTTSYVVTGSYFNCPVAMDSVIVEVYQIPSVIASEDELICPGEEVIVSAQSSVSGASLTWMPFNLSGNNQSYTFNQSTYVYVVANNHGCLSAPDSILIDVSGACFVEVPNVFTPNADGSNDWFTLVSFEGIESLSCTIVNRWGNTIKSFNTPNFAWDGRDNGGIELEEGVYFYVIKGMTNAQELIEKQGFVQLVRN